MLKVPFSIVMLSLMLSGAMLKVPFVYCYAECHQAECRYAESTICLLLC
jgi:hypothetical protein